MFHETRNARNEMYLVCLRLNTVKNHRINCLKRTNEEQIQVDYVLTPQVTPQTRKKATIYPQLAIFKILFISFFLRISV